MQRGVVDPSIFYIQLERGSNSALVSFFTFDREDPYLFFIYKEYEVCTRDFTQASCLKEKEFSHQKLLSQLER